MIKYEQSSVFEPTSLAPNQENHRVKTKRTPIEQCNVLFINPSINPDTQNPLINSVMRTMFPLSMGYIAGYMEHKGVAKGYFVDQMVDELDDVMLADLIHSMPKPRIIGFTIMTATCGPAYALSRKIRQIDPECIVVMGGVHATVVPDEPLLKGVADVVVRGEGEITFVELMAVLLHGEDDYSDIAGISYIDSQGKCIHNTARELPKNLDDLPPFPYHLFAHNADKYGIGFYSIQTSRGCPYKCTFCSQRSMTALSYRYVGEDRAIEDIETLIEDFGAHTIRLIDDNIAVNKKRLVRLLDLIIERGFHKRVVFEGAMRADNVDTAIFHKLKEANFTLLTYGLETASERLMKQMQKGETVQEVIDAIQESAAMGFTIGTTIIFGFPTETFKERWEAIKLVRKLPVESVRYNILTPYPGTPVFHEIEASGYQISIQENWANFSVQYMWEGTDLPYVPPGTNKYALMATTMLANLYFYLRPAGIKKMFTNTVAGGNVIVLPKNWFLSGYLFRVAHVGIYLVLRFLQILAMALLTTPIDWLRRRWSRKRSIGAETIHAHPGES